MVQRQIIRGDSYALRRPLYRYTFVNVDGEPFDLTGCVVWSTYKAEIQSIPGDPKDETAAFRHRLIIDLDGNVVEEDGLYLWGSVKDGVVEQRLTHLDTLDMPVDIDLYSDIQLQDAEGEFFTWTFNDTLIAKDSVTNRFNVA